MSQAGRKLSPTWVVLPLLLSIAMLNYADRYLLSGLAEPIRREFALSDGMMGLLMGPAFALIYTIAAIPVARLADRTSRVAVVAIGCGVWSGFTALTAFANDGTTLALARVGVGIGEAAYQAPSAALIAAYFPPEKRGRALALVSTSIYFGQMLGLAGGPAIAADHGWRMAFQLIGGAGIAIAATALVMIREPAREPVAAAERTAITHLASELSRARSLRNMTVGMGLGTLSGISFGLWGPALFERAYDLSNAEAGAAFALSFGLPGLFGTLGFGFVADRMARRGVHRPLLLSASALFAATLLILIATWMPQKWMAQALAVPSGLLGGGWSIGIVAAMQYVLPERDRATGTALGLLVVSLFGNLLGPWVTGQLSDVFGSGTIGGLRAGLTLMIPTGFLGAWLVWRSASSLLADRDQLARAQ